MPKTLRRTVSVLIAVAVTSLGLYGAVSVVGAAGQGGVVTASASPTATSAPTTQVQASAGAPSPTTTEAHAEPASYTCPVTGCAASTCHGATGAPPPTPPQKADSGNKI